MVIEDKLLYPVSIILMCKFNALIEFGKGRIEFLKNFFIDLKDNLKVL